MNRDVFSALEIWDRGRVLEECLPDSTRITRTGPRSDQWPYYGGIYPSIHSVLFEVTGVNLSWTVLTLYEDIGTGPRLSERIC